MIHLPPSEEELTSADESTTPKKRKASSIQLLDSDMWHRWFACASSLKKLREKKNASRYAYDLLYLAKQPKNDKLPSLGSKNF